MTNLRNGIVSGLAALVLAGCGASNASLKAEEDPWEEGVVETPTTYVGTGCSNSKNISLARSHAQVRARTAILRYVAAQKGSTEEAVEGELYLSQVVDTQVSPRYCVRVAMPREGIVYDVPEEKSQ